MKPAQISLIAVILLIVTRSAFAQTPLTSPQDLQEAQMLVQRMLQAQKDLSFVGDQMTVLYRPEQTFSASQTIYRNGDHALKLEYHTPEEMSGEVYVDNGRLAWHYVPAQHRLEVGVSALGHVRQETNSILRRLNDRTLTAEIVGHDVVAGQIAQIVEVTAGQAWGQRKYWIDPVTGAQLKIQTFGTFGQMVSETYFTRIQYGVKFSGDEFGPPPVDTDVSTVPMYPAGSQMISGLPTAGQCGFTPVLPSFVPQGFAFQSAFVMPLRGQKLVELSYENALAPLSIFEEAYVSEAGKPTPADKFHSPRPGVLTARYNGYQFIVVGSLPEDVMRQIVQSMR